MTDEPTTWQDEIARQRSRLEADLVSRHLGVFLTSAVFAFYLPFWFVFATYLAVLGCEVLQHRLMLAYAGDAAPGRRLGILANAGAGSAAYCLPALFVWLDPDPMVKFTALLPLMGALLSVSVVRSTHLAFGIASGLPAALALLWLPLQYLFDPVTDYRAVLAMAAAIILLGYFASALLQNHRMQQDLVAAAAETRAASEAKSRFLSAMSHEVRTPLNAILGHSQLLAAEPDPAQSRDHGAAIANAARTLQTILEDVTDLASATEGELHFRPVTAVIRPELEVLAELPLPLDAPAQPEIAVEIAPDVPEFGQFDPILLRKCLVHLCAMVLNGQPAGSPPAIDLRCALVPGRSDRLGLVIAGRGPLPDARPGLDDPTDGSLALSLVNRVAEVMGARATVLRGPDGSPAARIELPFVTVPDPPSTGAETVYGRLRALVVDDIATNRFILIQMLRALRIETDEVAGGSAALERLAERDFDLVLLDMNMPEMDGEATFREIRATEAPWASVPVVALTADVVALKRDYYLALGLNGFISKPVDRRLLWAEILAAVPRPPPL